MVYIRNNLQLCRGHKRDKFVTQSPRKTTKVRLNVSLPNILVLIGVVYLGIN